MANALVDFVSDPRYAKLSDAQRLDAFGELEPEFGGLAPDAQRDFITKFEAKYRKPVGTEKTGLPSIPKMQAEPEYVSPGVDLRAGTRKTTMAEDIAGSYKGTIGEAVAPEAAKWTADIMGRFAGATGEGIGGIATGLGNILHALGTVADSDTLRVAGGGVASMGKTVEREFKPEKTGGEGVMGQLPEIAGSAVGSMMGFRGVGKLVGKAVETVAGTGKAGAIANWLATSAVETGTTAGGVYADELEAGKDPRQAAGSAGTFAAISGPLTAGLNKLGQFNDRIRNPITKLVAELGGEIAQEDSEQITQNMVTGKPWNLGLPESTVGAFFGSLIGGAAFEHAAVTGIVNDYHEAVKEHGASPETARQVMEQRLTEEAPHTAAMVTTAADEKFDPFTEISGVLRESAKQRDAAVEEFLAEHPEYRDEVLGPPEAPDAGAVDPRDEDVPGEIRSEATADAPVEALPVEALPVEASIAEDPPLEAVEATVAGETSDRTSGTSQATDRSDPRSLDTSPQPDDRMTEAEQNAEEVYRQAVDAVRSNGKASNSFLQRNFRMKYDAAEQLLNRMEAEGIVGPKNGQLPREILPFTPPVADASPTGQEEAQEAADRSQESEVRSQNDEAAPSTLVEVAAELKPTLPKLKQRPFAEAVEAHGRWEAKLLAAREAGKSTAFIGKMVDKHAAVLRRGLGENYAGPLTAAEILEDAKIEAEKSAKQAVQPVEAKAKPVTAEKPKAAAESSAQSIPRPPTDVDVRRLPKLPRPRTKKAIAQAHAEQMGLAGGFYSAYGGGVDEILAVEESSSAGGYTYTVRDTASREVRKHSTRIDPRAVVFRAESGQERLQSKRLRDPDSAATDDEYYLAAAVQVASREGHKGIEMNAPARALIQQMLGEEDEGDFETAGELFTGARLRTLLTRAEQLKDDPDVGPFARQLAGAIKQAGGHRFLSSRRGVIFVSAGSSVSEDVYNQSWNEEIDHARQLKLGAEALRSDVIAILGHPAGRKAVKTLKQGGYENLRITTLAMEVGVRLTRPGRYAELGLTLEEAVELADHYRQALQRHGTKAGALIRRLERTWNDEWKQVATSDSKGRGGGGSPAGGTGDAIEQRGSPGVHEGDSRKGTSTSKRGEEDERIEAKRPSSGRIDRKGVTPARRATSAGVASADLLASPVLRGVELLSAGVRTFREWKTRLVEEYGPSIKHKAYSLWAAAKRLWNDESGKLDLAKLAEWYRDSVAHSLGEVVKPIRRRITEAGDGAGRELMKLLDKAGNEGEVLAGMLLVKLRDVELHKLNREQRFELLDVLEGRVSPDKLTDRMREVYTAARSVGDELAVIADDLDVMVTSKDGKRKFKARADYFPHVIRTPEALKKGPVRRDVIENLVRIKEAENVEQATVMLDNFIKGVESGRWDNRMLEYLIRTGQADSRAKALAMLQRYRSHVHRHGTLEHAREVNLPFYDPDPARVLPWVTSTSAIRLAQIAEFGQDHPRINAEILKIRDAGGDADFVRKQVDKILGLVMAEDEAEKRLSVWLRTVMSFKLGLAQIPNATQGLLNTMLAGDFPAVAAGVRGMLTKRGRRLAIESGAAIDPVLAEAARDLGEKRMIDAFLKWTGFSAAEQMNRVFAANAGADLAGRLVKRLAKMPEAKRASSWEWKRLEDLGVDPADAAARGKLSHGEMLMAAKVFSDMTQFRTRVQDQPSLAKYKVMWQFKSFAYNQGRLIAQEVVGEWRRGHPGRAMRAMLVIALFFPLVGDLVRALRDLIRGKDREFEDLSARYVAALSEVGGLGIAMDAVRSAGARRGLEFIAGPSLSEMARTAEVLASDKDQEEKLEALGKLAKKQIPFGSVVFDRGN